MGLLGESTDLTPGGVKAKAAVLAALRAALAACEPTDGTASAGLEWTIGEIERSDPAKDLYLLGFGAMLGNSDLGQALEGTARGYVWTGRTIPQKQGLRLLQSLADVAAMAYKKRGLEYLKELREQLGESS